MPQFLVGILLTFLCCFSEARIRLRKVKDAPKTCTVMKVDELLSRPAKPVWSTEKHSIVVSDQVTLVNDLGLKVCSWNRDLFAGLGDINQVRFYIDEYKEIVYPFVDQKEMGVVMITSPFNSCSFEVRKVTAKVELPTCEKPKKKSAKKKKKKKTT